MDAFLSAFRDHVDGFAGLQEENDTLRKELRERVDALREQIDAYSEHMEFVSVTGPGGSPVYSSGVDHFNGYRRIELEHYDNGFYCSVDELIDAELHIGNHTYSVSEAERIVCTNVNRNFRRPGFDLVDLDVVFDHNSTAAHLTVMFAVPRTETRRWTDLDIKNLAENPGQIEALRGCQLEGDDADIDFAWVKFVENENEQGDGDEEMDDDEEVDLE